MIQSLKRSRSMAISGVLLILLSLSASSAVFATCQTCNSETAECVSGNSLTCFRTVEIEYDEEGNVVRRTITCTSEGPCDWGAPEY